MPKPPAKFLVTQFCTYTALAERTRIPFKLANAGGPPSMTRPRRLTTSPAPAATTMALVPAAKTLASPAPSLVMLSDLVMVTAPKPPGSSTLISPPAAVLEIAPANVLHGAVREHGLTSSPTP